MLQIGRCRFYHYLRQPADNCSHHLFHRIKSSKTASFGRHTDYLLWWTFKKTTNVNVNHVFRSHMVTLLIFAKWNAPSPMTKVTIYGIVASNHPITAWNAAALRLQNQFVNIYTDKYLRCKPCNLLQHLVLAI